MTLTIDGRTVAHRAGQMILQAARGLGQAASARLVSAMRHFPEEFSR